MNGSQLAGGLGAGTGGCAVDVSLAGGNVTDGRFHVAMYVRSGGTVRLYVDGVIVDVQNGLCMTGRSNYDFQIGAMTTATHFFDGDIAEIQIYDRALNLAEIPAVTQTLATSYGLSGVAGTASARWVADSVVGASGSAISNWTDVLGGRIAAQATVGNRPKIFTNVINGHNVMRFSSPSSQYFTVPAAVSPISGAGSFAFVMVIKTSTAGVTGSSFYQNTGLLGAEQPGVVPDWAFCLNGSQLGAGLGSGTSGCGGDLSLYGGIVTDNNPHIAMYVRTGETVSLYVDGVRVATQTGLCTAGRGKLQFPDRRHASRRAVLQRRHRGNPDLQPRPHAVGDHQHQRKPRGNLRHRRRGGPDCCLGQHRRRPDDRAQGPDQRAVRGERQRLQSGVECQRHSNRLGCQHSRADDTSV
ncbi:MAG: LamG domain-containing protein [Limisphaerales bacterium]